MTDDRLRIVTLNAGSLLEPGWPERRVELVAWLDELDADIVCLQEIWEDDNSPCSAAWVVDTAAANWHWTFGGFAFPTGLWPDPSLRFGSAVLSRWPIDHHELIALPVDDRPELPDDIWRLQTELLHVATGGANVFSTHLAPPPAQAYHRVVQAMAIDDAVQAVEADRPSILPTLICGDFNAEPESDEIRFLCSLATINGRSTYFQDAWRSAARSDAGYTGDPRRNPLAASLHVPPKRIDYVFVGDPWGRGGAGRVLSADLAFHEARTGVLASDHFGLVVDITWPDKSPRP